jgi:hypothetical protein
MRTMGIPADMYLLAMVGQSKVGGGTSVELLINAVRTQVYSKGRRTKDEKLKELKIRDLKRYLDQGTPIMWTLCSMEEYNKIANKNTQDRKAVTDWKAYAATIAESSKEYIKKSKPSDKYHLCMIIGYNEETQELAVSDSWGPRYELRWVPVAVANWVSMGKIFIIQP